MADRTVKTTETIQEGAAQLDLSILGLIGQADIVVQSVMLMLVAASVWTWAIIFEKRQSYQLAKSQIKQFAKAYSNSANISDLYKRTRKKTDNPLSSLFIIGMQTYLTMSEHKSFTKEEYKERLYNVMLHRKNQIIEQYEKNLTFLATIGSASPFVGLFGTVWGIVNSFQAIAASKNTTLTVVAPGIAEALLATAIGLFAAIPAVMFYNIFINKLKLINIELEDYAAEFTTTISQELVDEKK
jgi:biopolymer transport protein TolQ